MYPNNEYKNDQANDQWFDLERVIYVDEFSNNDGTKDDVLPPKLLRLVEYEERQILPHQEVTKSINLVTNEIKKEVKFGTSVSSSTRKELINLIN